MATATKSRRKTGPKAPANVARVDAQSVWLIEAVGAANSDDVWVDEENGIIHNVLVLGAESPNIPMRDGKPIAGVTKGTRYTPEAFATGAKVMEGAKVRRNHPDRQKPYAERDTNDDLGVIRNCRPTATGIRAEYHYNRANQFNAELVEDVKRRLGQRGFSPNAVGNFRVEDGVCVIEDIIHVRSVDIVSDPATTVTLWNSKDTAEHQVMTIAFRELIRSQLPRLRGPKLKAAVSLLEADYMMDEKKPGEVMEDDMPPSMGDVPVEAPPEGGDPDEALKAGFETALTACVKQFVSGELPEADFLAKVKELAKVHTKLSGGGEAPAPAEATEGEDEEAKEKEEETEVKESLSPETQAKLARLAELEALEAKNKGRQQAAQLCESLNFQPTPAQLEGLAEMSESRRKPFVLDMIKQTRGPKSSGPVTTKTPTEAKPAATADEFLASISR